MPQNTGDMLEVVTSKTEGLGKKKSYSKFLRFPSF